MEAPWETQHVLQAFQFFGAPGFSIFLVDFIFQSSQWFFMYLHVTLRDLSKSTKYFCADGPNFPPNDLPRFWYQCCYVAMLFCHFYPLPFRTRSGSRRLRRSRRSSHRHQNVAGLPAQSKFLAMTCGTLHIHIIYQPNIVQNVKLAAERMASKPAKIQESSWLTHLECSCLSRSMTLFRLFQASKPCLGRVGRVYDVFHRSLR
jgi:hypothetical protein